MGQHVKQRGLFVNDWTVRRLEPRQVRGYGSCPTKFTTVHQQAYESGFEGFRARSEAIDGLFIGYPSRALVCVADTFENYGVTMVKSADGERRATEHSADRVDIGDS